MIINCIFLTKSAEQWTRIRINIPVRYMILLLVLGRYLSIDLICCFDCRDSCTQCCISKMVYCSDLLPHPHSLHPANHLPHSKKSGWKIPRYVRCSHGGGGGGGAEKEESDDNSAPLITCYHR